jgi:hypothetical protein
MVVKIDQIAKGEPFDASAVSMRRPIHIPLEFADSLGFLLALAKRLIGILEYCFSMPRAIRSGIMPGYVEITVR